MRLELRAVRDAVNDLRSAIEKHSETIHATEEARRRNNPKRQPIHATVSYDDVTVRNAQAEANRQYSNQESIKNWTRNAVIAAIVYAAIAACQWRAMTQQNKLIREQWRDEHRPRLGTEGGIAVKEEKTQGTPPKTKWTITTKIWNYGDSPAMRVAASFGVGGPSIAFRIHEWKTSQGCKTADDMFNNSSAPLGIAFPHNQVPESYWSSNSTINDVPPDSDYAVVCMAYTDASKGFYYTKLLYVKRLEGFTLLDSDSDEQKPAENPN